MKHDDSANGFVNNSVLFEVKSVTLRGKWKIEGNMKRQTKGAASKWPPYEASLALVQRYHDCAGAILDFRRPRYPNNQDPMLASGLCLRSI
jgi:hypothetical protein